ncbi:hypothetical protein [Roseomonas sp. KE2513]|uniref:hypothetical protein n=1 Tax=Roseomonas sp. KE2513 TaxID=2479202 RepID=UPI0018DF5AF6|nr:hypothetical protein [Roseomonas sp. KE2513]
MTKGLFVIGVLAAIALIATDAALALKRLFPDSLAPIFVGPIMSVVGVLLFTWYLRRRN